MKSLSLNIQNYKFLHSRQINNNPIAEVGHTLLLQTEFHAHVRNEENKKIKREREREREREEEEEEKKKEKKERD